LALTKSILHRKIPFLFVDRKFYSKIALIAGGITAARSSGVVVEAKEVVTNNITPTLVSSLNSEVVQSKSWSDYIRGRSPKVGLEPSAEGFLRNVDCIEDRASSGVERGRGCVIS
jgi:hypothetical protein